MSLAQFLERLLKFLSTVDGRDKTLRIVQYVAKFPVLIGKQFLRPRLRKLPLVLTRLNNLYVTLRSARFVTKLGYWINSLSRLITFINTGAFRNLSRDATERAFELLDMFETVVQLVEALLQDLVILSMFRALNPEINKRWRPVMNGLWMACLVMSGILMFRNFAIARQGIRKARQSRRRFAGLKSPAPSHTFRKNRPWGTGSGAEPPQQTPASLRRRGRHLNTPPPDRQAPGAEGPIAAPSSSEEENPGADGKWSDDQDEDDQEDMRPIVLLRSHSHSRSARDFDAEYGTPRRASVTSIEYRSVSDIKTRHIPLLKTQITKYLCDLTYCMCDTLQVYGRDNLQVQWVKSIAATTSAVITVRRKWAQIKLSGSVVGPPAAGLVVDKQS